MGSVAIAALSNLGAKLKIALTGVRSRVSKTANLILTPVQMVNADSDQTDVKAPVSNFMDTAYQIKQDHN